MSQMSEEMAEEGGVQSLVSVIPEVIQAEMSTISALEQGAIDSQIATAKAHPRSLKDFHNELMTYATISEETALGAMYSIPRAGKRLIGPSVRFAEMVFASYGNLRVDSQLSKEGERTVEVLGTCHDLQKNIGARVSVSRRITDRGGHRFGADMIQTTIAAAVSIAFRNSVLRVVPQALWQPAFAAAQQVAVGGKGSFGDRRAAAFAFLAEKGCEEAKILAHLERERIEDVTIDDVLLMRTVAQEINDGNLKPENAFPPPVVRPSEEARSAAAIAAQAALDGGKE